jgi:hypothetical protein
MSGKKKIIYKDRSWFAMPNHIGDLLPILTAGEFRMYVALLARGRGFVHSLEVSNQALMKQAKLDERSLPAARGGLIDRKLVTAVAVDGRHELYRYSFHENLFPGVLSGTKPTNTEQPGKALLIPADVLMGVLSPEPTLDGK